MRLSPTAWIIAVIIIGTGLYFGASALFRGAPEVAAGDVEAELFTVAAARIDPAQWAGEITIRGRTAADQKVVVRADASGIVKETPVAQGAYVKAGDVLCRLELEARGAGRAEARAALQKAKLDYDAAVKLAAEGFRSQTGVAGVKAAYDQAKAAAERAEIEYSKTAVRAPFDGVFDELLADAGDLVKPGDPCGVVIKRSPFLVKGSIAEKDVARIKAGDKGVARLATGEEIDGVVRFVSTSAAAATRTFDVELEVSNEEGLLRDGVTAEFTVFADPLTAHKIPRSALTLNDEGRLGVRSVGADDLVVFTPLSLVGEDEDGIWVAGLDGAVNVIVRGQDYVSEGQKVHVVAAGAAP
jgi:multidrug efflux system membrane fusion protein